MFEFIWQAICEFLEFWVICWDPQGIISWLVLLVGFGVAYLCADAGNWTAAWIFSALGALGVGGLIIKYLGKPDS